MTVVAVVALSGSTAVVAHTCMSYYNVRSLRTRGEGGVVVVYWLVGTAHMVVVVVVRIVVVVRGHPSVEVYIVVVGAMVVCGVMVTGVRMIGRMHPYKGGCGMGVMESEVGCGAVHMAGGIVEEPDGAEVDGHHHLFAGIGVVAVDPDLKELRVYTFGPSFVEYHVGLDLVFIACVDHQLVLRVEVVGGTQCL